MNSRTQFVNPARPWTPPTDLDRSRPRDVRLTASGVVLAVLSVLLCLGAVAAGTGLATVARRQAEEARLLRQEGLETEGRIVRLWRSRDDDRQPWMTYRFTHEGRIFERNAKVRYAVWKTLKVGAAYPIRYYPGRPELSHPVGIERTTMPMWLPFPVSCLMGVGGFLVTLPIRSQRLLLSLGRVAPATITAHGKRVRTSHGSDLGVRFTFEFPLLSGATAKGHAGPSKAAPAPGTIITILYDPENPARNAPYPLSLVRLRPY